MKESLLRTICVLLGFLGLFAKGDEPGALDFVEANVENVAEAGEAALRITVIYDSPTGVVGRTHDSGDLWITNSEGFHSGVTFVEWLDLIERPDDELPSTGTLAVYELAAPEGGWTEEFNGEYAVILASGEVAKRDGSHFELSLAGTFEVAVGTVREMVQPLSGEISVATFATPGAPGGNTAERAEATMTVTFPYPVEVNWGEVTRNDDGEFCVEVTGYDSGEMVTQVLTDYTRKVDLGMLGLGDYAVTLKGGDAELARSEFQVGGGASDLVKGLPSRVEIELERLPTRSLYPVYAANVRLTFGQYVERVEWSEASRKEELSASSFTAWVDPRVLIIVPMVVEYQVQLGRFLPGEYRYELSSLDEIVGSVPITVPNVSGDIRPPEVTVRDARVTEPGEEALEFSVEYSDPGELVVAGIEAQRLTAVNRRGEVFELERMSLDFTADFTAGAIATYRMTAPGGSWDAADRGRYRLLLSEPELVCDRFGNHLRNPLIGYVRIEIDEEDPEPSHTTELTIVNDELIGRWTASVRLFVPENLAVRDDWEIVWGDVRPVGPSFFLQPRFMRAGSNEGIERFPPSDTAGAGMWVEHDYDLGPVSGGRWIVCLNSNLGHFAKRILSAGEADGGNEPFDFWLNWAGRGSEISDTRRFWEYCVGTNPADPSDDHVGDPKPEIIDGEDGEKHLGLRCRMATGAIDARLRFEGSSDMNDWTPLDASQIEEVERVVREDGIEEFVVCLVHDLETSEIRYLRVVAERW